MMTEQEIFAYEKHLPNPYEGEFIFAAVGLAHNHINSMCRGLIAAGATLKYIYDDDSALTENFLELFPEAKAAKSVDEILSDPDIRLVASADIPSKRADLGIKVMRAGVDFFVDKAPFITLEELDKVKRTVDETGRKYFVYYSELVINESAIFARHLVRKGVIGKLFHIDCFAPHRLWEDARPKWFWEREKTGGIIIDIGSHQIEQFLEFAGVENATIDHSRTANYFHANYPGFDDFGEIVLSADNGITGYIRIDWCSPAGIETFGDLRLFLQGEKGYIELRKNCDIGHKKATDVVIVATDDGVFSRSVSGMVGISYYEDIINDVVNRSDTTLSPALTFNTIELAIKAQISKKQ